MSLSILGRTLQKIEKLYYFVPAVADDKKRLLTYYGEYYGDKRKNQH